MLEVDDSGITELFDSLDGGFRSELVDLGREMSEEGTNLQRQAMQTLIYGTPERGYRRTGKLLGSASGDVEVTGTGIDIVLEATGGAGGKNYAEYVSYGTYNSRIERNRALSEARDNQAFSPRSYPRGSSGLEPRPFQEPALAEIEQRLESKLLDAVDRVSK